MKKSLMFSLLLFLVIAVILGVVLILLSDTYIVRVDSPDPYFDLVSIGFTEDDVVENTGAYELDGSIYFVLKSVAPGSTDVTFSAENYDTGELGAEELFPNFCVNGIGMLYRESLGNDFEYWQLIIVALGLYFLVLGAWCGNKFAAYRHTSIFDYRTVFHGALTLLSLTFALVFVVSGILLFTRFADITAAGAFSLIALSVIFIMALTLPLALVFSVLVGVSNFSLIRHEGFRPVNVLGLGMGAFLSVAILVCAALTVRFYQSLWNSVFFRTGLNIVALAILFFEFVLFSVAVCAWISLRRKPSLTQDFIIIPGCAIRPDGTLYPLIKGRVDRALSFYREQLAATGRAPILVPSGGQGSDEIISEGEAMRRYLTECGVPESDILPETESTTTLENMRFSKELIEERKKDASVIFSTTKYHVFRSGMYAAKVGLKADGIGSPTKWYFWPNAFLREFVGLLVAYRKTEILIGLSLSAVIIVLTNLQTILNALS